MSVALLRMTSRSVVVSVLAVGLWLGAVGWVRADPLNPLDFASLGAFPTAPGGYTINTSGTPTLTVPGGTLTGVVSHGIAVFDFDAINITSQQGFFGTGSLPLALLSRSDLTINGTIDVSAPGGFDPRGGPGGFGGGSNGPDAGGSGPGGGGGGPFTPISVPQPPYGPTINYRLFGGGGGGGFGGPGNAGMPVSVPGGGVGGGSGGRAYADLLGQLQGGSGGGTGVNSPGGGGGGAIELGAVGNISVKGSVLANGGSAIFSSFDVGGSGGGAGGGIFLHGEGVTLSGLLSAIGGGGGSSGGDGRYFPLVVLWGAGGSGGGGQVVIDPGAGGFTNRGGAIDVGNGTIKVVPEPAGLVLLGLGLLGVLGGARSASRRAAA
ncbi:MAG: hypothetical protein JO116_01455 [Planctomycetaceae bacterium]|nr:hypothetical protein [Planctomycetaceae bacterium]